MILNCIAVDDEPLALGLLSAFIEQTPFLNLKGSYHSSVEALQAIYKDEIHLIFLDIQMPDLNGMELARIMAQTTATLKTKVIFTTAYNQFAIEGYKVDAMGYLLKPFSYEDFLAAVTKVKNFFELLQENNSVETHVKDNYLFVKADYKLVRIDFDAILFIESLKDYIKIHLNTSPEQITSLSSLKAIEDKLPPERFKRIHRSFVVAIDKIDSISKSSVNIGKTEITVGEQYRDAFKELISRWG
jgi:two-component system response regulator LytT